MTRLAELLQRPVEDVRADARSFVGRREPALLGPRHRQRCWPSFNGVERVGQLLVDATDVDGTVAVPLTCVSRGLLASLDLREHEHLRLLRPKPDAYGWPSRLSIANDGDDCPVIGGMARFTGRLGAAHAAYVALTNAAGVVTSRADQIPVGAGRGPGWSSRSSATSYSHRHYGK